MKGLAVERRRDDMPTEHPYPDPGSWVNERVAYSRFLVKRDGSIVEDGTMRSTIANGGSLNWLGIAILAGLLVLGTLPEPTAAAEVDPHIDAPSRAFVGERVELDASQTRISQNTLDQFSGMEPQVQYQWQISGPDYEAAQGKRTSVTFDEPGIYTVELTVTVIAPSSFLGGDIASNTDRTIEVLEPDPDDDGLHYETEESIGTDPERGDTDGDGLDDGTEVDRLETDPTIKDTDGDGLDDGTERSRGTDPVEADTDGDGLSDGTESDRETDPTLKDTDGDGVADGRDRAPTNPNVPSNDDSENEDDGAIDDGDPSGETGDVASIDSERSELGSLDSDNPAIIVGGTLIALFILYKL